ncbi:MAG TPA: phosphate ABC transporter permease subunit PstC [Devosia sp.]|nr:phosphate ABC transporter permease subunit PstC [Devosia sp.]
MWFVFTALLLVPGGLYFAGRGRAVALAQGEVASLHSKQEYHGAYLLIWGSAPALGVAILWLLFAGIFTDYLVAGQLGSEFSTLNAEQRATVLQTAQALLYGSAFGEATPLVQTASERYRDSYSLVNSAFAGLGTVALVLGALSGWRQISPRLRARQFVETAALWLLMAASGVAILTTFGIVFSLVFETWQFFKFVSLSDFLFGTQWSPQSAFEGAGAAATDARNAQIFGAVPVFAGTLLISAIAILVAAPVGLMAAIYLSDYAPKKARVVAKPVMELLAGIPTVVYGFFAALTVAPFFRRSGEAFGLTVSSESALAAGIILGVMIIPFVSSLSDDVISAVPESLRDGSAALGATRSETIRKVVLPAALPGIVSALMLAISRAIGETMIVVMAAGLAANLTINPLEAVTTVTVQIVTLLTGDSAFDSAKTLSAFALALVLFLVTLSLNIIALRVVKKYQEQYD